MGVHQLKEINPMKPLTKLLETLCDKAGPAAKQLQRYPVGAQLLRSLFDRALIALALWIIYQLVVVFARAV
jgi:hypothetical protein